MELFSSNQSLTAFVIIFGFILVFVWFINLMGPISLLWKIMYTIVGAIVTWWIAEAKTA